MQTVNRNCSSEDNGVPSENIFKEEVEDWVKREEAASKGGIIV